MKVIRLPDLDTGCHQHPNDRAPQPFQAPARQNKYPPLGQWACGHRIACDRDRGASRHSSNRRSRPSGRVVGLHWVVYGTSHGCVSRDVHSTLCSMESVCLTSDDAGVKSSQGEGNSALRPPRRIPFPAFIYSSMIRSVPIAASSIDNTVSAHSPLP